MSQELAKKLFCILIRSGVEVWVEQEKADKLKAVLKNEKCPQFIEYEDKFINKSDISGIFSSEDMADRTRRKNGYWQCEHGNWIPRYKKCQCNMKPEYRDY